MTGPASQGPEFGEGTAWWDYIQARHEMAEQQPARGSFRIFPEHTVTEIAGRDYPCIQSGEKGKVLLLAEALAQDYENVAKDLGPVITLESITQDSVEMIVLFDGIDGKFLPGITEQ